MKHIFTLLAAISLLICLFLVGLTVTTMSSEKTFNLGEHGERTYSFKAQELEFIYQGKLTTFDDVIGFKTEKSEGGVTGIEYDKQIRTATKKLPAATGFVLTVPALWPIAILAILPLAWLIGAFRKKKPKMASTDADDAAASRR